MAFAIETPHPVNHAGARLGVPFGARRRSRVLSVMSFLLWTATPLILAAFVTQVMPVPALLLAFTILALIAAAAAGSVTFGAGHYRHTLFGLLAGCGGAIVLFALLGPHEYGWTLVSCSGGCPLPTTLAFDLQNWVVPLPVLLTAAGVAVAATAAYAACERRA